MAQILCVYHNHKASMYYKLRKFTASIVIMKYMNGLYINYQYIGNDIKITCGIADVPVHELINFQSFKVS